LDAKFLRIGDLADAFVLQENVMRLGDSQSAEADSGTIVVDPSCRSRSCARRRVVIAGRSLFGGEPVGWEQESPRTGLWKLKLENGGITKEVAMGPRRAERFDDLHQVLQHLERFANV
jgi:hypothetical protein